MPGGPVMCPATRSSGPVLPMFSNKDVGIWNWCPKPHIRPPRTTPERRLRATPSARRFVFSACESVSGDGFPQKPPSGRHRRFLLFAPRAQWLWVMPDRWPTGSSRGLPGPSFETPTPKTPTPKTTGPKTQWFRRGGIHAGRNENFGHDGIPLPWGLIFGHWLVTFRLFYCS